MAAKIKSNSNIRVLLSEGSSTNVREMITALGPLGYTLDICDPNPLCMGRFSRYIHKVYTCPVSGSDPVGYLKFIISLLEREHYDVLFPANEQAYLFGWAKQYLTPLVGLAVSDFSVFNRLQTKVAFMQLLDEIGLPHPPSRMARSWPEIEHAAGKFSFPFYIKISYGTASTGVWRVDSKESLAEIRSNLDHLGLLDGQTEFLVQAGASGYFEQSHAIYDRGRLLAFHCDRRLVEGANGGPVLKIGVDRPLVRQHFEKIGNYLAWHGSLSIDYFWDEQTGRPAYIDANPRITEPMNALVNGINLADLQVRLSLGEVIAPIPPTQEGLKSHNLVQAMLGAAVNPHSWKSVLHEFTQVVFKLGLYQGSREGLTPVRQDPLSILPILNTLAILLFKPQDKPTLVTKTISDYSLGAAIPKISKMEPQAFL
ncbi:MAG TPA: hypothetical protein VMT91_12150 [Anaerolineales bacterium]|nr:hypothetical protein [Anaerolineales bacterium]